MKPRVPKRGNILSGWQALVSIYGCPPWHHTFVEEVPRSGSPRIGRLRNMPVVVLPETELSVWLMAPRLWPGQWAFSSTPDSQFLPRVYAVCRESLSSVRST